MTVLACGHDTDNYATDIAFGEGGCQVCRFIYFLKRDHGPRSGVFQWDPVAQQYRPEIYKPPFSDAALATQEAPGQEPREQEAEIHDEH